MGRSNFEGKRAPIVNYRDALPKGLRKTVRKPSGRSVSVSNNRTVRNSAFRLISFQSCRNSIFQLPRVSNISPYCTAAHGPVTSDYSFSPQFLCMRRYIRRY